MIPDRLTLGAIACIEWIVWAVIFLSVVGGLVARIRSTEFRRPRLMPKAVHHLARRWVGAGALLFVLSSRPAVAATTPAKTAIAQFTPTLDVPSARPTASTTTPVVERAEPKRTYVTDDNETYWDVAEATLGDGSRWREILDANPSPGNVDLVPAGTS